MGKAMQKVFETVEKNLSGLHPTGVAVLVRPYEPQAKGSMIILPPDVKERTLMIETRAVVVELGTEVGIEEPARAKPGDKVLISKMAGVMAIGVKDGEQYRLINNRDIYCIIEE